MNNWRCSVPYKGPRNWTGGLLGPATTTEYVICSLLHQPPHQLHTTLKLLHLVKITSDTERLNDIRLSVTTLQSTLLNTPKSTPPQVLTVDLGLSTAVCSLVLCSPLAVCSLPGFPWGDQLPGGGGPCLTLEASG